jgi:hypothetical protein
MSEKMGNIICSVVAVLITPLLIGFILTVIFDLCK